MPRLQGEQANGGALAFILLLILIAIVGLILMEYAGYTNVIPEIGPAATMLKEAWHA